MMADPKAEDWVGRWQGRPVVCIASGPSLTLEDCDRVRASGLPVIVTNCTYQLVPWADVLFGFDCRWWKQYRDDVARTFGGERLAWSPAARSLGIPTLYSCGWFKHFHNSGASAISLAIVGGASRVVLLGFDAQRTGGRVHWHADYPAPLGNARSMNNWPQQFKNVARYAASMGVPVFNASRETALKAFPRVTLDEALRQHAAAPAEALPA